MEDLTVNEINGIAYRMAFDCIKGALTDIRKLKNLDKRVFRGREKKVFEDNGKNAIKWFNERSEEIFGYGWCLHYSRLNPNSIRKIINRLL